MLEKDFVIKCVENSLERKKHINELRCLHLRMDQPIKRKLLVNGWLLP